MSIDCAHHRKGFSAYLDKQLDIREQACLEEHLCDCEECSLYFARQKNMQSFLTDTLPRLPESMPDIWQSMESKLPSLCDLAIHEISSFLDGELPLPAQEGVRGHLKDCPNCLKQFRALNTTNRLIVKGLELPGQIKVDCGSTIKSKLNESCTIIESELSAFIDQEMSMQRHRDITAHILECSNCSVTVRDFSRVGDLLNDTYKPHILDNLDVSTAMSGHLKVVPLKSPKRRTRNMSSARSSLFVGLSLTGVAIGLIGLYLFVVSQNSVISSENYLIQSIFIQPNAAAEAVLYER